MNFIFKLNLKLKIFILIIFPSIWPFINFINTNVNEIYSLKNLLIYALSSSIFFGLIYLIFSKFFKRYCSSLETATLISIFVILFYSYSITSKLAIFLFGGHYLITWVIIFSIIFLTSIFNVKKQSFQNFIFIICFCLFILPFSNFLLISSKNIYFNFSQNKLNLYEQKIKSKIDVNGDNPNVIYLILDEYSRRDILENLYEFDNSIFINKLKKHGFFIAERSTSNYNTTVYSLSSTLAMKYLISPENKNNLHNHQMLHNYIYKNASPTHDLFLKNDYDLIALRFNGSDCTNKIVKYCFSSTNLHFNDLESSLVKLTPINSLLHFIFRENNYADVYEFDDLFNFFKNNKLKKSFFAYIHLLLPHSPYRYDKNCNNKFFSKNDEVKGYLEQTKCANKSFLTFFDKIIKIYPNTIFILQSDHGPKLKVDWKSLENLSENWFQSYANLNAWYFPKKYNCQKFLSHDMTNVNTMRIIEDCIFGGNKKLIKNRWFKINVKKNEIIDVK